MLDTPNRPNTQEPAGGNAQAPMPMGPAIEAIRAIADDATWGRLLLAEVCTVIVRRDITLAERAFYLRLLLRLDRKRGVVDDSVPWLAEQFGTSEQSVRRYTKTLALDGLLVVRLREVSPGNNLSSEIAFPQLAKACLSPGSRLAPPPGADLVPNEVGVPSDRYGDLGEVNITEPQTSFGAAHTPLQAKLADDCDVKPKVEIASEQPEPTTSLTDWRATDFVRKCVQVPSIISLPDYPDLDAWREWLGKHGGAPEHVASWQGLRHALEIAVTARQWTKLSVPLHVYAIAHWIAEAHAKSKRIGSLGFVAAKILRRALDGDTSRVTDIPTRRDRAILDGWREWAAKQARMMRLAGIPVNEREMQSTWRVEDLQDMAREHGQEAVVAAIEVAISSQRANPEANADKEIIGWKWLDQFIEKLKAAPKPQPKAETDAQHRAHMRVHWAQQKAADDARLAEIGKVAEAAVARLEAAGLTVDRYVTKRGDQCKLLVPSQLNDLRLRFNRDTPIPELANLLAEAVDRFVDNPERKRTRVTAWSNLGEDIREVLCAQKAAA